MRSGVRQDGAATSFSTANRYAMQQRPGNLKRCSDIQHGDKFLSRSKAGLGRCSQ